MSRHAAETLHGTSGPWRPSIRTVLLAILATLAVLVTAVMFGLAHLQSMRTERRFAASIVDRLQLRVEAELRELLSPLERRLATDLDRIRIGGLPRYQTEQLTQQLLPSLRHLRAVDSMMIGDEQGYQYLLMRWSKQAASSPLLANVPDVPPVSDNAAQHFTRDFRPSAWGERSRWALWSADGERVDARWEVDLPDYDPRQRPWHAQALQRLRQRESDATHSAQSPIVWTDVYTLFTTKMPGVSASAAARCPDGSVTIVAYDLLLDELRAFVTGLEPTPRGKVFLSTSSGAALALPGSSPEECMQPIAQVGTAAQTAWSERWLARTAERESFTFENEGETWWGSWLPLAMGDGEPIWLGVVVPRADLFDLVGHDRGEYVGTALLALFAALLLASFLAWRFQRPLREVVAMSRNIGNLQLDETNLPTSRIAELHDLLGTLAATRTQLRQHIAARDQAAEQLAEREAQLQQTQRLEAVGRLAGGIAHDFNNLMTGMLGHLSMARQQLEHTPAAADLDSIERALRSGAALTRQLLTFARRDRPKLQVVDVGAVLRGSESLLRRLLREDVELTVEVAAGPHPVCIDQTQLQQVIVNLAINARDAIRGAGHLQFRVTAIDAAEQPQVEITCRDDGCGMSEQVMRHAFEPFFTSKPAGEGTGLGLTTSYGIVQQAGGEIRLTSRLGLGTTVIVRLPRSKEPAGPDLAGDTTTTTGTECVLCVEDDDAIRDLSCRMLRAHGYQVIAAANGREALRLAQGLDELDLLLTDVVMPGLSGGELANTLLRQRPRLPVLFVSGYTSDGLDGTLPEGASFLCKPYTPTELLQRVREVLDVARTAAEVTRPPPPDKSDA